MNRPRRLRRGSWEPLLPVGSRRRTVRIVPVIAIGWGYDYIVGPENAASLSVVEGAAPMPFWGTLCLLGGVIALAGFYGRWRRVAVTGLWLGGITFTVIGLGQWWAVAGVPWMDGLRGPLITSIVGIAQMMMADGYADQDDEVTE